METLDITSEDYERYTLEQKLEYPQFSIVKLQRFPSVDVENLKTVMWMVAVPPSALNVDNFWAFVRATTPEQRVIIGY